MLKSSIMTTRTFVFDRSCGLTACQLSKIPRRIQSPAAIVATTAAKVMRNHVRTTRRASLDSDFKLIVGAIHVERRAVAGEFVITDTFLVHPLDVRVSWIGS